jgi:hypothetical protein
VNNGIMAISPNLLDVHSPTITVGEHMNLLLNQSATGNKLIINSNISASEIVTNNHNSVKAKIRASEIEFHGNFTVTDVFETDVLVITKSPTRTDIAPAMVVLADNLNFPHISFNRKNRLNIEFADTAGDNLYINAEAPINTNKLPSDIYIFKEPLAAEGEA